MTESEASAPNQGNAPVPQEGVETEAAENNFVQETAQADEIQGSQDEQEGIVIAQSTEPGQPTSGSAAQNDDFSLPKPNRVGLAAISVFIALIATLFGRLTNLWKPA